jgi:hypothetical protein
LLRALVVIAGFLGVSGCFFIQLNPVTNEEFEAAPVSDPARSVEFLEPMVWVDYPGRPTNGVRFLPGVYVLEAESEEFMYFRSPARLEIRALKDGAVVGGRDVQGGLALSKAFLPIAPASAYVWVSETRKRHVMNMGHDFRYLEGKSWTKTFDWP